MAGIQGHITIVLEWVPGVRFCLHLHALGPAPLTASVSPAHMRRWREILVTVAIIGGLAAYWIASEVHYARSISPKGVATVRDFFDRFGEPQRIRMVERDSKSFYEFTGRLPSSWSAAVPSSAPAYVFDEQGQFVAWCRDPGDAPSHRRTWSLRSTNQVEIGVVKEKFGI